MIDKYGIDPLKIKAFDPATSYYHHTISAAEDCNPQAVARTYYGSHNLFPQILAANGMVHQSQFTAGKQIRIPVIESQVVTETKVFEV